MNTPTPRRALCALLGLSLAVPAFTSIARAEDRNPPGGGVIIKLPPEASPQMQQQKAYNPNPQPVGGPGNSIGSVLPQATIPSPTEYPVIERDALAKKLDVSYRRAFLEEIVGDLSRRAGLRAVYPVSIAHSFMVSLEGNGLTVKEVLQKVADGAKLKLDFQPDQVIISQPTDDAAFNKLVGQLKDKDRWTRCSAVADLGNLGDQRVAGELTAMLKDTDPGVSAWAVLCLQDHACFLPALKPEQASALNDYLQALIAKNDPVMRWAGPLTLTQGMAMDLLADLHSARTQQEIVGFLEDNNDMPTRAAAAASLATSGYPDATQVLGKLFTELSKKVADLDAKNGGKNLPMNPNDPDFKQRELLGAVYTALTQCPTAEAAPFLQGDHPMIVRIGFGPGRINRRVGFGGPTLGLGADGQEATLRLTPAQIAQYIALVKQTVDQYSQPATQPDGKEDRSNIVYLALNALSYCANDNSQADDLIAKVTANPELMAKAAQFGSVQGRIGAYNKQIIQSLVALLEKTDDHSTKLYILRSLGTSHIADAADALIKHLQAPDAELRAEAAKALSHTRDSRAVSALIECLKTPGTKLDWPDLEAKAIQEMKQGRGVRMQLNPRRVVAEAIAETRDPKALDALLAVQADKSIEQEARAAAMEAVINTALDSSTIDAYVQAVQKLEAADQRAALHLDASRKGWFGLQMPSNYSELLWCDPRIIELDITHSLDPETFQTARDVRINSRVTDTLYSGMHPRDEFALLKLAQSDADEHLTYFAGRDLSRFGDPNVEVKMEK